ncbi:hypothetical protein RND71_015962 [Anisodus tanguticus]|uniref:Uncharacterized protein n=1 Tax=Anisodus tanguticus TaxID=243964 RepID=A0AAE1S593_9SOLA|nr:hypothetical protein RND71_015962 [Anisodus tanguticus]
MILNLIYQIKDLERQVKERKDRAHKKEMQAARKLNTMGQRVVAAETAVPEQWVLTVPETGSARTIIDCYHVS